MAQQVGDPALSLWWHGFNPSPVQWFKDPVLLQLLGQRLDSIPGAGAAKKGRRKKKKDEVKSEKARCSQPQEAVNIFCREIRKHKSLKE